MRSILNFPLALRARIGSVWPACFLLMLVLSHFGCEESSSGQQTVLTQVGGALNAGAGASSTAGSGGLGAPAAGGGGSQVGGAAGSSAVAPPLPLQGQPCTGYTLLGIPENDAGADFTAMLIDMAGTTVHRWSITGFPPKMLPGGSLVGCVGVVSGSYDCVNMQQVSWDGELEWSFSNWVARAGGTTAARHHHDFQRQGNPVGFYAPGQEFVPQGTTLVLAHSERLVPAIRDDRLDDDVIYEVDWSGTLTGFEWHGVDHVEEFGFDAAARDDIRTRSPGSLLEWLHGNSISRVGANHWFDEGYSAFHPDNIIYSSRNANFVIIIAHDTGNVVWRVGPDFAGRPEEVLGQFAGQHNPHLIPRGLPGAGNMLVFDNGGGSGFGGPATTGTANRYSRDYSRVLEFDPITMQLVWDYGSADDANRFFSAFISNAQRLPNGNTLITIGNATRVIEVTPLKQIVWEYVHIPDSSGSKADWLYRSYRIPPEWLPTGQNEAFGDYATWASIFEN